MRQVGCDPLRERYTIASWPWETQQWPDAWMPLLDVADELWPSSQFTAAALAGPAAEAGKPLQVMPMAAEITDPDRFCNPAARIATRQRHGLPVEAVVFGHGFDLNSTRIRKNPMGALQVFKKAFPLPHLQATFGRECTSHPFAQHASLLIKTSPPRFQERRHFKSQEEILERKLITILASIHAENPGQLLGTNGSFCVHLPPETDRINCTTTGLTST